MSVSKPLAPLFYEDLVIGQVFQTAAVDVTAAEIVDFAARYDPQPFHLDETSARQSFFGELVASGWMTAALTMGLLVRSEMKLAGGLIGLGLESVHWPHAVRPGDCLRATTEVLALRTSASKPEYGIVKLRTTTRNQADNVVQVMVANQLVLRREKGAVRT